MGARRVREDHSVWNTGTIGEMFRGTKHGEHARAGLL